MGDEGSRAYHKYFVSFSMHYLYLFMYLCSLCVSFCICLCVCVYACYDRTVLSLTFHSYSYVVPVTMLQLLVHQPVKHVYLATIPMKLVHCIAFPALLAIVVQTPLTLPLCVLQDTTALEPTLHAHHALQAEDVWMQPPKCHNFVPRGCFHSLHQLNV